MAYSELLNTFFSRNVNGNDINLLYANIRSLRKNFDAFLIELSQINSEVNIIVLSETWINSNETNLFKIPNYNMFYKCNDTYRAGGVICYISQNINVKELEINFNSADTLLLKINIDQSFFNLFCIYRLQSIAEYTFLNEFNEIISNLSHNTIIIGDVNINLFAKSQVVTNYLNILHSHGFEQFIDKPTRITNISETCIDHIFIRDRYLNNFKSEVFDANLTDHCLLGLNIKSNYKCKKTNLNNVHRDVVKIDYIMLNNKLENTDWNCIYNEHDVNISFNRFHELLLSNVDTCKSHVRHSNKLNKALSISPWISDRLLRKLSRKKKLYRILKKRPYDIPFKNYYKTFCNNLNVEIIETKNKFYSKQIEKCHGDSSMQWRIINRLAGRDLNKCVDKVELSSGEIIVEPVQVANEVNKYFIATQTDAIDNNVCTAPPPLTLTHTLNSFFMAPTTEDEVLSIIKNLKNKKSSGFDNLNVCLIKNVAKAISPILCHIFNLSFLNGIFPELLKSSVVVPILKNRSSLKIQNLRPISLLSVFSKIIEKIVKVRLVKYLDSISFFSESQFGFRAGKSTEDALIKVVNMIYSDLNDGNKVSGLFIDFRKAFDLVDHNILLAKLEAIGVRGPMLNWFKTFLIGRKQQVKINNVLSSSLLVKAGVPQGSVIAATLFLVFINDFLKKQFLGIASAFADDIAIFYPGKNINQIFTNISEDLLILKTWCMQNKMIINVDKTKYMNFDCRGFLFENVLKFHDLNCTGRDCNCPIIERVEQYQYLGILLDDKLTWEKYTTVLANKLKSSIRTFYFLNNICSEHLMKSLYFALIHSRLQYAIHCWGGTFKYNTEKLRVIQNFFIRIILHKNKRESSFPLFKKLNILPLQHLYIFKVLKIFYIRSGNTGTNNLFYNTRCTSRNNFRLPKVKKSLFRRSFDYVGPKYFNILPCEIKNIINCKLFLLKLKKWLFLNVNVDFFDNILI